MIAIPRGPYHRDSDPTELQIQRMCGELQKNWSKRERLMRGETAAKHWTPPVIAMNEVAGLPALDLGEPNLC